jgi:hypothetical protein
VNTPVVVAVLPLAAVKEATEEPEPDAPIPIEVFELAQV